MVVSTKVIGQIKSIAQRMIDFDTNIKMLSK